MNEPLDASQVLSLGDYRQAARARERLRLFHRRSDEIARRHGLTPQRYHLLLMIKGAGDGRQRATVDELARRLQLSDTTAAEFARRAAAAGLVAPADDDELRLTEDGERLLARTLGEIGPERESLLRDLCDDA